MTVEDAAEKKANELIDKFKSISLLEKYNAKECAIICCTEILTVLSYHGTNESKNFWEQVLEKIKAI